MSETQYWIVGGVAFYLAVMLGIGFFASRMIKDSRDYIVAGGHLGWFLCIGTIFATWFGSETCMGASGMAADKGILGVISDPFGAGLCLILAGALFAGHFRKLKIETVMDYFEIRYDRKIAVFLSVFYIPVYLGWIGAQLLAFGTILAALTGVDATTTIVVATMVVILYTYWGGMWADTLTDTFQMIVLIGGLLVLFPVLISDMGGWTAASAAVDPAKLRFFPASSDGLTWLNYLQAWMIVGIGSLPAQDLFQRIMAARDARVARWSSIIAGVMYMGLGLIPVLLGILGREAIPDAESDQILIALAMKYLPGPAIALMVGALLSAIMSSADSAILAPASIIGHNIVPYLKPGATQKDELRWCRFSVPLLAVGSLCMALYADSIYELCQAAWGVLLVGVAAPLLLGMYWRRATPAGAITGAVSGTGAWLAFGTFLGEQHPAALYAFCLSCCGVVVASLLSEPMGEAVFMATSVAESRAQSDAVPVFVTDTACEGEP